MLSEIETAERLIDANQAELDRLKKAYQAGVFEIEDIQDSVTRLKTSIKKLSAGRDEARRKLAKVTITEEKVNTVLQLNQKNSFAKD